MGISSRAPRLRTVSTRALVAAIAALTCALLVPAGAMAGGKGDRPAKPPKVTRAQSQAAVLAALEAHFDGQAVTVKKSQCSRRGHGKATCQAKVLVDGKRWVVKLGLLVTRGTDGTATVTAKVLRAKQPGAAKPAKPKKPASDDDAADAPEEEPAEDGRGGSDDPTSAPAPAPTAGS